MKEDEEAYAGNFYRNLLPANYNFDLAWLGSNARAKYILNRSIKTSSKMH